jgi:hypothetical protein
MSLGEIVLIVAVGALGVYVLTNMQKTQHGSAGGGEHKKSEKEEYTGKGHYLGTPGFYTKKGHHHCKQGSSSDCICTDPHKCTKGSHYAHAMTDLYGAYQGYAREVGGHGHYGGHHGRGNRMIDQSVHGRRLSHN